MLNRSANDSFIVCNCTQKSESEKVVTSTNFLLCYLVFHDNGAALKSADL